MGDFQPELGQWAFSNGQIHEHEAPELLIAVLYAIGNEMERVMWNLHQEEYRSPLGSYGTEDFETPAFVMRSYCWCEGDRHPDICPPNFQWRDLKVSWYKHASRGVSCNRPVSPDECAEILTECLAAVRAMDVDYG